MKKVYRVNMAELSIMEEQLRKDHETLGGRGLTSMFVAKRSATCLSSFGQGEQISCRPRTSGRNVRWLVQEGYP